MAYFLYFRKRPSVRVSCLRRTFINQPYYRMKRYLNLLFLAAAALCASCARDAVVSDVPPKGEDVGGYDNNVIVPGWVRIRLDDEAAPLRTGVFTRGEADSGNPLLDELAAGLGATEIREVFPTDPGSRNVTGNTGSISGLISGSATRCPYPVRSRSLLHCPACGMHSRFIG